MGGQASPLCLHSSVSMFLCLCLFTNGDAAAASSVINLVSRQGFWSARRQRGGGAMVPNWRTSCTTVPFPLGRRRTLVLVNTKARRHVVYHSAYQTLSRGLGTA